MSFSALVPYLTSTAALCVGCFFLGVFLSQKVKDFVGSTPASFRTAMKGVEANAKADVQHAIDDIFHKLNPPAPEAPPVTPKA